MIQREQIIVIGQGGLRGRVVAEHVGQRPIDDRVTVQLDRGGQLIVHPHELRRQADGTYRLGDASPHASKPAAATSAESRMAPPAEADEQRIELAEERLHVGKQQVEGKVRVHVDVQERQETVDVALERDVVRVERVPINRQVDTAPSVRAENDTLIVPVLEEVLKVEKQLMLREEVRLIREKSQTRQPQQVTLRREEAHVEREETPGQPSAPRRDPNR